MTKILIAILSLVPIASFAQSSRFTWADEMCEYRSIYDSALFSSEEIAGAYSLVKWEFALQNTPSVYQPEDITRLCMDSLEREYRIKKEKLSALEIPDIEVWEKLKQSKLDELEQLYKLSKIAYKAYAGEDQHVLLELENKDTCSTPYANALVLGGDSLLNMWYKLTAQRAPNNADPGRVWSDYYKQLNSSNRLLYAKVYVLTFGWWNCAVRHIDFFDHEKAFTKFRKLFLSTEEITCDIP